MRSGGAKYRDESRLEHMLSALERVKAQLPKLSRGSMQEGDDSTELALYNLEMIGEDANNISDETCERYPQKVDFPENFSDFE